MTQDTSNTKFRTAHLFLLLAILLAFGAMVYSNTFDSPLIFDDEFFIIKDTAVHMTELSGDAIKTAAIDGKPRHRYLPNISWALNYYFGQLNPFGYHLINLIIHLLSGIFLFFFIKSSLRIYPGQLRIRPELIAFFAALLWIVQPVGTQSVTYICQRMASMVALFYILSLLLYVKGRMAMRQAPSDRLKPFLFFSGCLLAVLCAIATKENAGTLPLVILLYEWFFFQDLKLKWTRNQILWSLFFILIFAGAVVWYMGGNPMIRLLGSYRFRDFSLIERVMTEWRIVVYYLSLFLWTPPGRLNLDHDYPLSLSPVHPATTILALAAILGLLAGAAYAVKKDRLIAFGILWFFITQATESTIIGIELVFEHRTYIPFMMISLLFVVAIFRMIKNRPLAYALIVAATLVFSAWTYQRNQIWQNPITFWTDAMIKSPNKPRAYKNLAYTYQQHRDWSSAALYYKKALSIDKAEEPNDFATYANLGAALLKQNFFFDAVYFYSKAISHRKADASILQPLAFALTKIGELEAAKNYYQLALDIDPDNQSIQKNITDLTVFLNQFTDPDIQIHQLLDETPNNPSLRLKQGDLFGQKGQLMKAVTVYQTALTLTDDNEELLNRALLSRLAKTYFLLQSYEDALAVYRRLIDLTPDNAQLYYNTAAVYAVQGNFSLANAFLDKSDEKGLDVEAKIKTDPNFEKLKRREVESRKDE